LYGDDAKHIDIRDKVCQHVRENKETYAPFVENDMSFEYHVERMSELGVL
jgi:hypothetical protein